MEKLIEGALHLGLPLSAQQVELFQAYYDELIDWNRRMNLTAIVDYDEVQIKHFLDSLTVSLAFSKLPSSVVDVGTGAGLPGVALKIAHPGIELTLIDSTQKKAVFLNHLVDVLGLKGVEVLTGRAEELAHDARYREHFDAVLSRGVAKLAVLTELTLPFCAVGGAFIAMKNWPPDGEVDEAERSFNVLGGRLRQIVRIGLWGLEDRSLVVIDKARAHPGEISPAQRHTAETPAAAKREGIELTEELKPNTALENGGLGGEKNFLRRRFFNFRTLISLMLAIGLIVVIFTQLNVNFSDLWDKIKGCNHWYFALAFISYYLTFPLRALRWRYLLHHAGIRKDQGVELPSLPALTQMVMMNWFANSVLYARLGDAYRAYLFKDRTGVSFSKTLGTLLAERFLDILVIVLLTVVSIIWLLLTGGHDWQVFGIVLGIGIALLLVIAIALGGMGKFGHKLVNLLPKKIRVFYTMFEQGALSSFGQLRILTLLTVVIWLLEAGRLIMVAQALGFDIIEVGIALFIFAALGNALITAIPLTPGGLGLVELGVPGLLMITSLSYTESLSITLVDRAISFLSVIAVGLLVFAFWHVMEVVRKKRSVRADIK